MVRSSGSFKIFLMWISNYPNTISWKGYSFPIVFSQHLCKILNDHKCKDLILGSQFCFIDLYMFRLLPVHACPFYVNVFRGSAQLATLYSSASSLTISRWGLESQPGFQNKDNMGKSFGPKHPGHSVSENSIFV